nr:reverse transcriptase domain-containing protein [Tanacetum cinerariifolium]
MGPLLGTTQATTTTTSVADLQRAPFTTPYQMVLEIDPFEPPPASLRNKGSDLEVDNLALEGVAPELAPRIVIDLWNGYRNQEDEDTSRPWRHQKVDAFTRRISDFSEDKRRRMPANVKTYDGTSDLDDHLKIFESAATIENQPQTMWCHMFNSTLVGNARNWFNKLPRRSIDGFEETHQDRVPQTFDELMKHTRSFIQGEAAAADSKKSYSNYKSQEQPGRQSNDQSSNHNNSYRNQRGDQGNDKYTLLTKTPKEILATEGTNFPKPPPMRTPEEWRVGNGYYEYHGQKGHTTNEYVQLRQLIDKLVKEGRLDHLVKNIKEGKDKQKNEGKKDTPKDNVDTIYMVQSWQQKTRQKVSQKFSRGSEISFPTLTADNTLVEPLAIEINAGGHDIHRMCIDEGASADILYEHWKIRLLVIVGNEEHSMRTWMTFMVIRSPSPYNGIIGRPGISAIRAIPSMGHGILKFPVDGGIVTIYNTTIPPRECNTVTCNFVYRANGASHAEDAGKLGPKWEGPYEVTEALGNDAYKLRDMDGRELPRTWNICNLKRCYL